MDESSAPKEIASLKKGDYFGELALQDNSPRKASIIAVGTVRYCPHTNQPSHFVFQVLTFLWHFRRLLCLVNQTFSLILAALLCSLFLPSLSLARIP